MQGFAKWNKIISDSAIAIPFDFAAQKSNLFVPDQQQQQKDKLQSDDPQNAGKVDDEKNGDDGDGDAAWRPGRRSSIAG